MIFISCKFALLPFQTTYSRFLFYLPLLKNFPVPRSFFFFSLFLLYIFFLVPIKNTTLGS